MRKVISPDDIVTVDQPLTVPKGFFVGNVYVDDSHIVVLCSKDSDLWRSTSVLILTVEIRSTKSMELIRSFTVPGHYHYCLGVNDSDYSSGMLVVPLTERADDGPLLSSKFKYVQMI